MDRGKYMSNRENFPGYFRQSILIRGLEYHRAGNVRNLKQITDSVYTAHVEGTEETGYTARIDLERPHLSSCDCPFASKDMMCKHMAAVFFEAFPEEADKFEKYLSGPEE